MVLAVKARGLSIGYEDVDEVFWAVRNVSLEVEEGEALCIVGESGSGKTTLASAIAGTLPPHAVTMGELYVGGRAVIVGGKHDYSGVRGRPVTYIPQNPGASLSPYLRVGEQFYYVLRGERELRRSEAMERARGYLKAVGLDSSVLDKYPHELSGGMQQRAAMALALSTGASILVADEPTSSLDAHLRLQVVKLLDTLKREMGLTLLFITHDLTLASALSERIAVMHAGTIVEVGPTKGILSRPLHPYTVMLAEVAPVLGVKKELSKYAEGSAELEGRRGGCPFYPHCSRRVQACASAEPELVGVGERRYVACWLYS